MSDAQIERIVDMYNNKTEFEDTSQIAVVPEAGNNITLTHNFVMIRCQNDLDPANLKAFLKVRSVITYLSSSRNDCVNNQSKSLEKVPVYVPKKLEE